MSDRSGGRPANEMRPVRFTRNYLLHAEGSCLVEVGNTRVLCAASVESRVPPFLKDSGQGWVTAEYSLLPRSTQTRVARETMRPSGRTLEIQRLIGRSLRSIVNLPGLGERTVVLDCDVIQADGGTRTAAITGAYVAMIDALNTLVKRRELPHLPVTSAVAAISVGIVQGSVLLDLDYSEDSTASVDMNVVMTDSGHLVEIQGTAEGRPFDRAQMNAMVDLAERGISGLLQAQRQALEG